MISKIPLLFVTLLQIHDIQMQGRMIVPVLHVIDTSMIEVGIDNRYMVNNQGGNM